MRTADDIARIIEQESALIFESFDEATAFAIGSRIRERALEEKLPIVVDIQLWDRPLFYCALPGSTVNNTEWARRKRNVVRTFHRSTYRMVLEQGREDRTFKPGHGLDIRDYVLAGGGFPISVKSAGVIGAICVSGLPEREDHGLVVATLCEHLGIDSEKLALAAAPATN
jgi:uncharacterized protein (UPF0303 family)